MSVRVEVIDEVGSTNDEAVAWAEAGAALPMAVRARVQSGGRGRHGRAWSSPAGGVWISAIGAWEGVLAGGVSLRAALGVWEAVAGELDRCEANRLRIKWPNDLLLDGRKVCGVLCERRTLRDGRVCAIVGVGINADFGADELPADVRLPGTTLRSALGRAIDADVLAERVAEGLADVLSRGATELAEGEVRALAARLAHVDEPIEVRRLDGGVLRGTLGGIGRDGRLAVLVEGVPVWVSAGDVDRARAGGV